MNEISKACPKCGHQMKLDYRSLNLLEPRLATYLSDNTLANERIIRTCECGYRDAVPTLDGENKK